jgi:hypothetical protein
MTPTPSASLPDPGSELSRLTTAFLAGSLSLVDRDRLVALLRDPEARAAYRKIVWLHANLMRLWSREMDFAALSPQAAATSGDAAATAAASGGRRWSEWSAEWLSRRLSGRVAAIIGAVALATAVIMIVVIAGVGPLAPSKPPTLARPPRAAGAIAEVAAVELPAWMPDANRWLLWDGLLPGAVLELQSGRIELAFDGGTQLVLEGPASFVVDGPKVVSLRRGKATVTVRGAGAADGRSRFTVQTPSATVTDIGTSFGVLVDKAGETSVTVFDGLVDLLPRGDGALPVRLVAGESGVASKKEPARKGEPREKRFVRSLERPSPDMQAVLAAYGWDESRATTIYRDSFSGSGPLAGSRPADRGGFGDAAWVAPKEGWQLDATRGAAVVTSYGSALLPVTIESGRLYLVSATIHATAGSMGFGGVGFTNQSRPEPYLPHGPWMLQRHDAVKHRNESHVGPGETRPVGRGDRLVGEHVRSMLLDTTGPTWRAVFLADGEVVGESLIDSKQAGITHVCLAAFPNTQVSFRQFSISSSSHLSGRSGR